MLALTSGKASFAAMASASGRLLLPVRIFISRPLPPGGFLVKSLI